MTKVTLPFIGIDISTSKVNEVMTRLCLGTIEQIDIFDNYDSKKKFRSAEITFSRIYEHNNSNIIMNQLGEGGEIVILMKKNKTSRWIMRNHMVGGIFGMRPKDFQKRIYITI
jgi:hypothetical protein